MVRPALQSELAAAREIAEEELSTFPPKSYLRYASELSRPDRYLFAVIAPSGRNCGTVSVNIEGGLVTRVRTRPVMANG